MNKKIIYAAIIFAVVVVAGLIFMFVKKSPLSPSGQPVVGGNQNAEAQGGSGEYTDYFSSSFLGKLPADIPFSMDKITKTKTFVKDDQFCVSLTIKQEVPAGKFATEVYDATKGISVQPKTAFPQAQAVGDNTGCENLRYGVGKYEYRVYVNDALSITLPFEVK
ncbi:MAG: hypothetical protein PHG66_05500 [Candidatus Colwellbacteria bacterium]|nr:hypothetical protein [Candidatus Colwellbacteria bacterium]